ncbi:hypothetical protein [Sphingorhabdus sp. M41]|uniref:hypothetical protein n=1 Tax=Sphingorhabdus sp. M41 TaxID=1806885 RepID=UPI0012E8975E|nr:hypothetical protein [Sphingorhabdus sp. M41]
MPINIFVPTFSLLALVAMSPTSASATPAAAFAGTDTVEEPAKKTLKLSDRRHPDYVRCRSEPIIGSLAKKRRICMTNKEWAHYVRTGSRYSKEFVDDNQPGFMWTPK